MTGSSELQIGMHWCIHLQKVIASEKGQIETHVYTEKEFEAIGKK